MSDVVRQIILESNFRTTLAEILLCYSYGKSVVSLLNKINFQLATLLMPNWYHLGKIKVAEKPVDHQYCSARENITVLTK